MSYLLYIILNNAYLSIRPILLNIQSKINRITYRKLVLFSKKYQVGIGIPTGGE